jgi:hypothetical protein
MACCSVKEQGQPQRFPFAIDTEDESEAEGKVVPVL